MAFLSPARLLGVLALAGLALFLALRPSRPRQAVAPSRGGVLPAPAPSADSLAARPSAQASLVKQIDPLDIAAIVSEKQEREPAPNSIENALGEPGSRKQAAAYARRIAAMRRKLETGGIPLDGETASLLQTPEKGGQAVIIEPPQTAAARPESPEILAGSDGSWSGSFSPEEEGRIIISDEKTWLRVWSNHSREPAPVVDFSRHSVAAVFLGLRPSGGYKVRVVDVKPGVDELLISWRETTPPPGKTPPEVRTTPFTLRLIPKTRLAVRFKKI